MSRITPFLWFATEAEQAAEFYVSIFPNSSITSVVRYREGEPGPAGSAQPGASDAGAGVAGSGGGNRRGRG